MNKSMISKRKKKAAAVKSGAERSERKPSKPTAKKSAPQSERAPRSKPKSNGTTCREQQEPTNRNEKKTKSKGSTEFWSGEETAKKMVASGFFNNNTINGTFKDLPTTKPPLDSCPCFKNNLHKVQRCLGGHCHYAIGIFLESTVAMTAYTLEILPDGCSNSLLTTIYHLHNWKQKRALDRVEDLVATVEKVLKTNENTVFMSMNGTGRAGTMLALFTAMLQVQKGKEVNPKETMEKLRAERFGLVETAEQYGTVHKAMALWFKNKSTSEEIQKI
ncbi:Protein CBG10041 [Caenorhabditis briggsae]|uniref:Protein CBG10041 n=1 Tax=Caenorhabditis briggsae TaxID=6238 RepID=A8XA86_CAEBR|nr:Protein CBG10041 [Caenorhabditis briggsae]CAP29554.2 Protein CBG10041 [Caenorhabditis briggsae]